MKNRNASVGNYTYEFSRLNGGFNKFQNLEVARNHQLFKNKKVKVKSHKVAAAVPVITFFVVVCLFVSRLGKRTTTKRKQGFYFGNIRLA